MNEHQRKVMPRIEFQRIADDAVITQVWPDGTRQQLTMPLDQALILADWIVGSAEDHDRVARKEPHPSPEEETETGASGGCTRTAIHIGRDITGRLFVHSATKVYCAGCGRLRHDGAAPWPCGACGSVELTTLGLCDTCRPGGICKALERAVRKTQEEAGLRGPVEAIADGDIARSRQP